jgi:clan AA aspartic protease
MITGVVQSDEARIQLVVKGPKRRERKIEAVIDTGFTGTLSLPLAVVAALSLRWHTFDRGILADGSECLFDVYEAEVVWDGNVRRLLVHEADTDPLIGMTLLRGYELRIQVRNLSKVHIKRRPSR